MVVSQQEKQSRERQMTDQASQIERLHAIQDIANLQGRYMYHLEGHRYDEVLALFARHAPDVSVEIGEGGVYIGRAKVETMFTQVLRPFFTMPGMMPLHMLTTPVIEVDCVSGRGHGMWQTIGCNSFPEEGGLRAVWQQGTYDNLYLREDGEWRILRMRWLPNFRTSFDRGWVKEPVYRIAPLDWSKFPADMRPDLPPSGAMEPYDPTSVRRLSPQPPEKQ
jgi:hypothetical protein